MKPYCHGAVRKWTRAGLLCALCCDPQWYVEDAQRGDEFGPHYGVIDKLPKAGPSGAFQLRKHALPAEQ